MVEQEDVAAREQLPRSTEVKNLLQSVTDLLIPFIHSADEDSQVLHTGHGLAIPGGAPRTTLVERHPPHKLESLLKLDLPQDGLGAADLADEALALFKYSVNTSAAGFMDKLYSSPSPPGMAGSLLLAGLNTNSHVYGVSPALSLIEKATGAALAKQFGLQGPHAGGVTVPGGAASNTTSMLVARNVRFPELQAKGMGALKAPLAIFVSEAAHYSISSAAQTLGFGSNCVHKVKASISTGAMDAKSFEEEVQKAKVNGEVPFYVCATSGTTVRGGYDPLEEIATVAHKADMWFHIDACWGGGVVFSEELKYKMKGSHLADSISFNPHKMLGVPVTCSFLIVNDLRSLWLANKLEAGYLFHSDAETAETSAVDGSSHEKTNKVPETKTGFRDQIHKIYARAPNPDTVHDLASFTPQCGRPADSLKLFLHWRFYGTKGIAKHVETSFKGARAMEEAVRDASPRLKLVGDAEGQCTQVCFYYTPQSTSKHSADDATKENTATTREIARRLVLRGFMVDYAPPSGSDTRKGEFLRVVCNRMTTPAIAKGLVLAVLEIGDEISLHEQKS